MAFRNCFNGDLIQKKLTGVTLDCADPSPVVLSLQDEECL